MVFSGHSKDVHSLHVYTVNGHLLTSSSVQHRITAIHVTADYVLTGDENGDLILRDLLTPKVINKRRWGCSAREKMLQGARGEFFKHYRPRD